MKAHILKTWKAPCCYLVTRVHKTTPAVVRLLNIVQFVIVSINSWGLKRDIMSEPETQGSISLAGLQPHTLWVESETFVKCVQGAAANSLYSTRSFEHWPQGVELLLEERISSTCASHIRAVD